MRLHDPLSDFKSEDLVREASRVFNRLASSISPVSNPHAILLGGQPGAGKTTITRSLIQDYHGNAIVISGDDYRNLHPNHDKLVLKYGKDATPAASAFSGAMAEHLIDKASKGNYNLIIEGTLRTTDVPLRTCHLLTERGYIVELSCMAVRPKLSYVSTLYRYEHMREIGTTPRATAKAVHDQTVERLPGNLSTLYGTGLFESIRLHRRDGLCIYDSTSDRENPADALMATWDKSWSSDESEQFFALVNHTEALMAARSAPELPSFLRERTGLLSEVLEPFMYWAEEEMEV